jgi:hypothetical protein
MLGHEVSALPTEPFVPTDVGAMLAADANLRALSLAYCELYVCLAALVLRVFPHLELFETTVEDVEYDHDLFVAGVKPSSKGVRVIVK